MTSSLPTPAKYLPLGRGLYEVAPGLFPFGQDFGQGELDKKVFQFDQNFADFRNSKLLARAENLEKYAPAPQLSREVASAAAKFLIERLALEWPEYFTWRNSELKCELTNESIFFDEAFQLKGPSPYRDSFDAIASQVQEDFAIVVDENGCDKLALLHVCSPSHWAPSEKMGGDFKTVHSPVPGIEKMNKAARSLVNAMIHKGPFVRFVWSFVTDQRLNHHPEPPPNEDRSTWRGRAFSESAEVPFHLRVERQITWGLPEQSAALFFIRVSFVSGEEIRSVPESRDKLVSALNSMTPESRQYKGVSSCFNKLIEWLSK